MRIVLGLFLSLFLMLCVSSTHAVDDKKIIDMTYPFAEDTLHWPTAKPFWPARPSLPSSLPT